MNSYKTKEVVEDFGGKAQVKSQLSLGKLCLLGIMAGAFIAVGYLAFVRITGTTPKNWGSFSTFLGACLFPIGLLAITFLGGELVTGNMMVMTFGYLQKKVSIFDVIRNWILVLLTNCLGGFLIAYLFGHIAGLAEGDFAAKTIAVATSKLADTPLQMIVSGIGCNILVGMAIFFGAMSKDYLGKIMGIWFPIMVFVVCGFQHVVANAFILPAAVFAGAGFSMGAIIENIFFVFIGNALGGALFLAVPVYFANVETKKTTVASKDWLEQTK